MLVLDYLINACKIDKIPESDLKFSEKGINDED